MTRKAILRLFSILEGGGLKKPPVYSERAGVKMGVDVFFACLQEITESELQSAAFAYLTGAVPFWPTPGQLLDLVPHLEASEDSHKKLTMNGRASVIEAAVLRRVPLDDGARYRQAFRLIKCEWDTTPADRRLTIDDRGRTAPHPSILAVFDELPKLLPPPETTT
ncbi:MAG: hypothetical protein KAI41_02910 [Hyphomicrobiaceae bacterium]|nr:hypothetical protein [Hyphomicrobiaceae bacterium]MCK5549461.1 hypothetical protein [Hyphomicrobiaceae bacterium]